MGAIQSRDDIHSRKHKRKPNKYKIKSSTSLSDIKHQFVLPDHVSSISSFRKSISTASSCFDEDLNSSCTSEDKKNESSDIILEKQIEFVWKHPKRPFLAYNKNDDKEYERQLRQHYVLKHILKGNIHVPISKESPVIILDSACGAGFWTLDMAIDYPNAKVIGLDAFPERNGSDNTTMGAPNIVYKMGDLTSQLQLPSNSVDIIYQRDAISILPNHIWPLLLNELKRVAKPGAYIELVEYNFTLKDPGPVLTLINDWYRIAFNSMGITSSDAKKINTFLIKAGFKDIKQKVINIPIGEWHSDEAQKENGFLYKQVIKALFCSMKNWWVTELDISLQEYDRVVNAALKEIDEQRSSIEWVIYTAKKPL